MPDIYAMRRANGDWFAVDDGGRLCLPLFHSSHDAFMARLRTVEMLLFSPIALDTGMLKDIVNGRRQVDFCLVKNPFGRLKNGSPLHQAEVASLISSASAPRRRNWFSRP